jgi:osmotically-inducible protein OsmY
VGFFALEAFMSRKHFISGLVVVSMLGITMSAPIIASAAPVAVQKPTDADLKDRINFRIDTSNLVRKYDIKVAVANGVATLTGDVSNAAQKAEAGRLAKIAGITKVENNITIDKNVDKSLADKMKNGMSKTGEKIDDAWITTKINWFFVGEDTLKGSKIDVDTKNNVVTLKGTVTSLAGKNRAAQLARQTDGVKNVINNLTIGPKK